MGKSIRINPQNDLFYVTYSIYLVLLFVNQTELVITLPVSVQQILRIIRYVCYILFAIKIITTYCYKRKFLVLGTAIFVATLFCTISSNQMNVLILAIICIASCGCDYKKVIKITTIVFAVGLFLTIILCYVGVMNNQLLSLTRERYNLGFNWVTLPQIYFLFITIGYYNIRQDKISIVEMIVLEIINLWIYEQTDTRLAFVLTTCVILFIAMEKYFFANKWPFLSKVNIRLCVIPLLICAIVFFVQFQYAPGNATWNTINNMLSGRLQLAYDNFSKLPITLFGQDIDWQGFSLAEGVMSGSGLYSYNNVDCSYFRILFDYGVAGLLITIYIYTKGIRKAVLLNDYYLVFSYLVILLFSITEQWMVELSFNPFVLVAVSTFSIYTHKKGNAQKVIGTKQPSQTYG